MYVYCCLGNFLDRIPARRAFLHRYLLVYREKKECEYPKEKTRYQSCILHHQCRFRRPIDRLWQMHPASNRLFYRIVVQCLLPESRKKESLAHNGILLSKLTLEPDGMFFW